MRHIAADDGAGPAELCQPEPGHRLPENQSAGRSLQSDGQDRTGENGNAVSRTRNRLFFIVLQDVNVDYY